MSCPGQKWQKTVKKGLKTNEIPIKKQEKNARMGVFISLEQVTGLEPVISAWKANVLPLHYTCILWSGKRGSNPPPQPWQGCALPNELFPQLPFSVLPEKSWCGRRDLNSYACRHQNLNLARLPIPPRPHARQRIFGDPSEIRTPDTLIKSQVLYRLS